MAVFFCNSDARFMVSDHMEPLDTKKQVNTEKSPTVKIYCVFTNVGTVTLCHTGFANNRVRPGSKMPRTGWNGV